MRRVVEREIDVGAADRRNTLLRAVVCLQGVALHAQLHTFKAGRGKCREQATCIAEMVSGRAVRNTGPARALSQREGLDASFQQQRFGCTQKGLPQRAMVVLALSPCVASARLGLILDLTRRDLLLRVHWASIG